MSSLLLSDRDVASDAPKYYVPTKVASTESSATFMIAESSPGVPPGCVVPFAVYAPFDIFSGIRRKSLSGDPLDYTAGSAAMEVSTIMVTEMKFEVDTAAASFAAATSSAAMGDFSEAGDESGDFEAKASSPICPFFLRGACRFRKNCRLRHDIGRICPYCSENLPERWTQQSKHLKRCWESALEVRERKASHPVKCIYCTRQPRCFGILEKCDHIACFDCASKNVARGLFFCGECGSMSESLMPRDRIFVLSDVKAKAFGLMLKRITGASSGGSMTNSVIGVGIPSSSEVGSMVPKPSSFGLSRRASMSSVDSVGSSGSGSISTSAMKKKYSTLVSSTAALTSAAPAG